ncbi:protein-tyrosine-phosphatase [Algoriphagus marincola]|uniref:Protein-tyrosine-phosphatase n=1 Tax=Algoriphagus marincola TaxID=264027 RepID=A0ABS7N530_9BACT|nr:protein-tyrosine-phosphatase [Algoriphagus marincola]MBY5951418.1 protein-tyrosine-phosphatase [Algoriphagus marincola]
MQKVSLYPTLAETIQNAKKQPIPAERKAVLEVLISYIQSKLDQGQNVNLNFICTHNSRRSQFSQIWAQTVADFHGIPANCYSGGVEVTAFNDRAVSSLKRSGFRISYKENGSNPIYSVFYSDESDPIIAFSKVFDDPANDALHFAAVMTCDHADENCPFIPGTERRIPVRYEDPKAFDGTDLEAEKYDERSLQIASEMLYVFFQVQMRD